MKWKNIQEDTNTFFITATVNEWQPLFKYDAPREIIIEDFEFYRLKYNALIHAYVIMPEHYHLLLKLEEPSSLHSWLRDFQSHTASEISKWLRADNLQRNYTIDKMVSVFKSKAKKGAFLSIWKEQARSEGITSIDVLKQKLEYIHANPVRRGLVSNPADWPFSSWNAYFTGNEYNGLRIDRVEMS